jgi:hypothetical protein
MQKLIGITAISAIIILSIGILPPPQQDNEVIVTNTNTEQFANLNEFDESEFIDNLNEFDVDDLQEIEFSIIDTERVFTESDDSLITKFLDEQNIDSPLSAEKFGIETQVALFDSDNNVYNISDVFGIPQLSVTDDEGRVLDLGAIQVTFESISKQKEKTTDVWGTVEFFLDDTKVDSKYIWGSGSNSDRLTLSLLDSLSVTNNVAVAPSFSEQEKKNHTFTLSDEGRDWVDGSEHTYRVVITKLHANANSEQDPKEFHWTGQHIAYELKVKVNEKKKVVYDYTGKAIQVFKSDNTLQLCGESAVEEIPYRGVVSSKATPPNVIIKDLDENIIVDASFNPTPPTFKCSGKHCFGQVTKISSCSEEFGGIPRNADLKFIINNDEYEVKTDSTQTNYYVNAKMNYQKAQCVKYECGSPNVSYSTITNFGYEK